MKEKVLTNKKNGMLVLLLTIILYVVAASGVLVWAISPPLYLLCVAYLCLGWLVAPGLKVLGPQEALVHMSRLLTVSYGIGFKHW